MSDCCLRSSFAFLFIYLFCGICGVAKMTKVEMACKGAKPRQQFMDHVEYVRACVRAGA